MKNKPSVSLIVCGRFHYNKYLHFLFEKTLLNKFIYSYRIGYDFKVPARYLQNFPMKEYFMYAGRFLMQGKAFYTYLSILHRLWQRQVNLYPPAGNIAHFLVHGNCIHIMKEYKRRGIKLIGEIVNAHPVLQEQLLEKEYARYGLNYEAGEKTFKEKIIGEMQLCDYLLAPSSFIKQSLIDNGIEAQKIKVLPYGLNVLNQVKNDSFIAKQKKIKLLCISQITFRKGIIYLLNALDLLEEQGISFELTLVGKIDPGYEKVINGHLKREYVHHIPHVQNEQVHTLMMSHDLFIISSIEDGCSVVVLEALSANLPVIVTRNNGASELVVDGLNGFIVEAFSAFAISDAIVRSIEYTFNFSNRIPTWKNYADELEKFYCSVLV